jgi:hypothetical protein
MRIVASILLAGVCAYAQTSLRGPAAGLIYEPVTGSLRYILGVPGSAVVGPVVRQEIEQAWPAPGGSSVILRDREGAWIVSMQSDRASRLLDGVSVVAWNADGTEAVAYSATEAAMQRIAVDRNGAAVAGAPVAVSETLGQVTAVAVHSPAQPAAMVAGSRLYLTASSGLLTQVAVDGRVAAVTFDQAGNVLAATDNSVIRVPAGQTDPEMVISDIQPSFIAAAPERLIIADSALSAITVFDQEANRIAVIPVRELPAGMTRLGPSAWVLPAPAGNSSIAVLDATESPRIVFIPALEGAIE